MVILLFAALVLFVASGVSLIAQSAIPVALIAFGLAAVDGAALWPHLGGLH